MASSPPPRIFAIDRRTAVRSRMATIQRAPDAGSYLFHDVAEDVAERLGFLRHVPTRSLVLGDVGHTLDAPLHAMGSDVHHADPAEGVAPLCFDQEQPWPVGGFDLIVSMFTLDTANDLPGALIHMRNALVPGGLALVTMLGAGSLSALRAIMLDADADRPSPRIHPQVDVRAGAQLLQRAGFADPVADSRSLNVRYRSFSGLVADLRAQGLSNVLAQSGPPLTKAGLERALRAFAENGDAENRVTEHFELLTLSGWRR